MVSYRLSENTKLDLKRIYMHGLLKYGEAQADKYFDEFFERFEQIAQQPLSYPSVDKIRFGYRRSVCGVDNIYFRISSKNSVEIMAIIGQQDTGQWL
ncbi:MAG: type II toxin-antitoxin system RelE/ParE family toxin [Kangiellaceae bacterium]|nr:type II toxin-antitoxin system RelE/ParE family toxin [Kangiellaceae bacterium]